MALITASNPVIALDDGHGMGTAGKRTPTLPAGLKSETGSFMHENEFNRAVVKYLDVELKRCGFRTVFVAPTDGDTSLSQRCRTANNAGADLYISVHANALTGKWGNARGIETLSGSNPRSKQIARVIHNHIKDGTPQLDRGIKDGSWLAIVKQTNMPAILVEAGFMDNLEEAKLLLTDAYRRETAREIAEGICEVFGRKYIPATKAAQKPASVKTPAVSTGQVGVVKIVVKEGLNLRNKPHHTGALVRKDPLPYGSSWKCYGEQDGWYDLGSGWVSANKAYAAYTALPKPKGPVTDSALHKVQVGAFSNEDNAEALADKLEKLGFDTAIVQD